MTDGSFFPAFRKLKLPIFRTILWLSFVDTLGQVLIMIVLYAAIDSPAPSVEDRLFFLFILLVIVRFIGKRRFDETIIRFIEERIAGIRVKVMDAVRSTDLHTYEQIGSEQIYTLLTSDMKAISDVSQTLSLTTRFSTLTVGMFLYLITLSLAGFIASSVVLGMVAAAGLLTHLREREALAQVREQEARVFDAVNSLLAGFKQLRLNDEKNDDFFHHAVKPNIRRLRQQKLTANQHFIRLYTLSNSITICLVTAGALYMLVFDQETHAALLKWISLVLYFPIHYLMYELMRLSLANTSLERFRTLEHTLRQIKPETPVSEMPAGHSESVFHELRYTEISFEYETQSRHRFTLGPLTLACRPGEIVFLTGGNGSGKTTLLKLLTGLYAPHSGQVLLNGESVGLQHYRMLFAPVFQDAHLFDRLYGLEQVDEERLQHLLQKMQIDRYVQYTDGRFSTLDLSTGQKKRLALVCAMLEDRPIYMFDEWAAEQDPPFRRYFYETLLPEFKARGNTLLAITHDDRWFHVADRVLRMEYGQLVI